jgi:hypothetical protein
LYSARNSASPSSDVAACDIEALVYAHMATNNSLHFFILITACHSHLYAFIQDILQPELTKPHRRSRSMPEEAVNSTAYVLVNSRIVALDELGCFA